MTCPGCGRWAPMDPETGYDADELCEECKEDELFNRREDEMAKTMDQIVADVSAEAVEKIDKETEDSRFFVLDVAEVFLSISDRLRMKGNAIRKSYRERNADPQLTKHK
jgi:hypothetical protein